MYYNFLILKQNNVRNKNVYISPVI